MSLVIRPATEQDVSALVELARTTFHDAYIEFDDPAEIDDYVKTNFTRKTFIDIVRDPSSTLLLALQGIQFVGYLHIVRSEPPACVSGPLPIELKRLYLRQDVIGKGNGAELMQRVFAEVRRADCRTLWLVVYDKNVRAVEFYKRFGFAKVGTKGFPFGGRIYQDPVMARAV